MLGRVLNTPLIMLQNIENERKKKTETQKRHYAQHRELDSLLFLFPINTNYCCRFCVLLISFLFWMKYQISPTEYSWEIISWRFWTYIYVLGCSQTIPTAADETGQNVYIHRCLFECMYSGCAQGIASPWHAKGHLFYRTPPVAAFVYSDRGMSCQVAIK